MFFFLLLLLLWIRTPNVLRTTNEWWVSGGWGLAVYIRLYQGGSRMYVENVGLISCSALKTFFSLSSRCCVRFSLFSLMVTRRAHSHHHMIIIIVSHVHVYSYTGSNLFFAGFFTRLVTVLLCRRLGYNNARSYIVRFRYYVSLYDMYVPYGMCVVRFYKHTTTSEWVSNTYCLVRIYVRIYSILQNTAKYML